MPHAFALGIELPRLAPTPAMRGVGDHGRCTADAELRQTRAYLHLGRPDPPCELDVRLRTDLLDFGGTDVGCRYERRALAEKAAVHDMADVWCIAAQCR